MLAPDTKKALNLIIERMGFLEHVEWDPVANRVDLHFRVSIGDASVEPADEYWEWPGRYIFRLTGVARIVISPHKEKIPPELKNANPSQELMSFLLRTFEDQGIYEWDTFVDPTTRFTGLWAYGWVYQIQDASVCLDFACVFKERGTFPQSSACWIAGFWFQELQILTDLREPEFLPVEVFISRYESYAARIPDSG